MSRETPALSYYRACAGAWRGDVTFAISDPARFAAASLSAIDRARVRATCAIRARIDTSVTVLSEREVLHTTRITQLGMPSLVGREVITLREDGRTFTMHVHHRMAPFFVARESGPFEGEVDADGRRATYHLALFGVPMLQVGSRDGDHVTLVQTTAWSTSDQRLARVR
ncbi:hypothetical protein [Sandaracinus amylolyticus]|uniref:DUF3598 domain-containing protein n=1 Tax=Sandaracinus amylolyticus TaxID=927083 RepID=A0A0F6YH55_9BACT|nr:hypothetical protein [Sandaracinus amylolyticus]AKF04622.1 hypothetical protein DB32_001771 [Sandaracinus amylolyticus]